MGRALFCVGERYRDLGFGAEVALNVDDVAADGVEISGDVTGTATGAWPPRITDMELVSRGGRAFARLGRDIPNQEVFGPRFDELVRVLERLDTIPWLASRERADALADSLSPRVQAFLKGLRRSGPVPPMKVVVTHAFTDVRAVGVRAVRVPGIASAIADDMAARRKGTRNAGACIAQLAAVARLVRRLAEPLFRAALIDFPTDPDTSSVLAHFEAVPPPVVDRARVAHEALGPLATDVGAIVTDACIQSGNTGVEGIWLPERRVAEHLVDELRIRYPIDRCSPIDAVCASAALQMAWKATSTLLMEMLFGATCHVASVVLRPPGLVRPLGELDGAHGNRASDIRPRRARPDPLLREAPLVRCRHASVYTPGETRRSSTCISTRALPTECVKLDAEER